MALASSAGDIIDGAQVGRAALLRCLWVTHGRGFASAAEMIGPSTCHRPGWSFNLDSWTRQQLLVATRVSVSRRVSAGTDLQWAEADTADAAAWMRRLARDRELAARIGQAARASVGISLSPQRAAKVIGDHLARIDALLPTLDFVHSPPRTD